MEPVVAVGLAAAIVSFIQFSSGLIKDINDIQKSANGVTTENATVETVLGDLNDLAGRLACDDLGETENAKALRRLAAECSKLASRLMALLDTLRVREGKNSKWQSVKAKWASMMSEKEVQMIDKKLEKYQTEISLRLNLIKMDDLSLIKSDIGTINKSMKQFASLLEKIEPSVQPLAAEQRKWGDSHDAVNTPESFAGIEDNMSVLRSTSRSMTPEDHILGRLSFKSMFTRKDHIIDAESGTFRWMLEGELEERDELKGDELAADWRQTFAEEKEKRKETRESFISWLQTGDHIYHIVGKAGSGKSTIMKFLAQSPQVHEELRTWAGAKTLVFATFFFWSSGDEMQRSEEGLYRAILFEVLKQSPELIPTVFPDQWRDYGVGGVFSNSSFRLPEIKAAFKILASKGTFSNHRFCFFIDGLDECEGDSYDHGELATTLKHWVKSGDIKLCVSSRPHTEFLCTFSDNPNGQIYLQDLTRSDIYRYARAAFENHIHFDKIQEVYMDLMKVIIARADGVFLWVRLVIRSLLVDTGRYRSPRSLKEKLEQTPRDLTKLFESLLNSIETDYRVDFAKILLITTELGRPPNALAVYWLEDLNDKMFPFNCSAQEYSDNEIEKRHEAARCQLDGISRGLLEMTPCRKSCEDLFFKYEVQLFHRTVNDHFPKGSLQTQLGVNLLDFDSFEAACRLRLAEIKFARYQTKYSAETADLIFEVFQWMRAASEKGQEVPFDILEELSRVLSYQNILQFGLYHDGRYDDEKVTYYSSSHVSYRVTYLAWALYAGQGKYVYQKISTDSGPPLNNTELSQLLGAALKFRNLNLEQLLRARGASSNTEMSNVRNPNSRVREGDWELWVSSYKYDGCITVRRMWDLSSTLINLERCESFQQKG